MLQNRKTNHEFLSRRSTTAIAQVAALALGLSMHTAVLADGTETLGPPSVAVASGSGIVAAGTGMATQPGQVSISVPAAASVRQVLLYWSGEMLANEPGDDEIIVNPGGGGIPVSGALIGGPTLFFGNDGNGAWVSAYRADITDLNLITPGNNAVNLGGLDFSRVNDGAALVVIYQEDGVDADIMIRDGVDLAYIGFPGDRKVTVPQIFSFVATGEPRSGTLSMFFGSAEGEASTGGPDRPSSIEVTTGGVTETFSDLLGSNDGEEWDTVTVDITIPAGADSLTVEAFSRDDLASGNIPASFSWIGAALAVISEAERGGEGCTPGYWKQSHHLFAWSGYAPDDDFESVFGVDAGFTKTLRATLQQGGGGENALARHAVAALLNATSSGVDYLYTEEQVIAKVQSAYATGDFESVKNQLEKQNESGCSLGNGDRPGGAEKPGKDSVETSESVRGKAKDKGKAKGKKNKD